MPFSIDVNGRTYSDSDFTASSYAASFLRLLADCLEHVRGGLSSPASTVGSGSGTPSSLTLDTNKGFNEGMPVVIFSRSVGTICLGTITAYNSNSGTASVAIHRTLGDTLGGERADWVLTVGGLVKDYSASPYTGDGSLTSSSLDTITSSAGEGRPDSRLESYFQDFCGYYPKIAVEGTAYSVISTVVSGLTIQAFSQATVEFEQNQLELFSDPSCPGVCALTCKVANDYVSMTAKGDPVGRDDMAAVFRVYVPKPAKGELFTLALGFFRDSTIPDLKNYPGVFLSWGYSTPSDSEVSPIVGIYTSVEAGDDISQQKTEFGFNWQFDRWITVRLKRVTDSVYEASFTDSSANSYPSLTFDTFPASIGNVLGGAFPGIFYKKVAGKSPNTVYVDYIGGEFQLPR